MKYLKFLALCITAFAFAACDDKNETGGSSSGTSGVPTVETSIFSATVKYTFDGLSTKDIAYGSFLTLYCVSDELSASYFEDWKNGNNMPACGIYRGGVTSTSGNYEGTVLNLLPDTKYDYCICFLSDDGNHREMSKLSSFRTNAFAPEFTGTQAGSVSYQKAEVKTTITALSAADMKNCMTGFAISGKGSDISLQAVPDANGLMQVVYKNFMPASEYVIRPYAKVINTDIIVYGKEISITTKDFDEKKVDLGLPSGICWAECNLDAESWKEFGNYYYWADMTPNKPEGEVTSYNWFSDENGSVIMLCDGDIAGSQYDPAHVRLGGKWRMPKVEDIKELMNSTYVEENVVFENMRAMQFEGKSNHVFLRIPFSGSIGKNGGVEYYWDDGKAWTEYYGPSQPRDETKIIELYIPSSTQADGIYYVDNRKYPTARAYRIMFQDYSTNKYGGYNWYRSWVENGEQREESGFTAYHGIENVIAAKAIPIRPVWDPNL